MIIIGIDQCGAKGRSFHEAKPLPIAILVKESLDVWRSYLGYCPSPTGIKQNQPLTLSSLDFDFILSLIGESSCMLNGAHSMGPIVLAMDCVLGLPNSVYSGLLAKGKLEGTFYDLDLCALMLMARDFTEKAISKREHGYGFKIGLDFFNSLLHEPLDKPAKSKQVLAPLRLMEEKLSAQSVFNPYPFQRNIQTGTFRIWSDLGLNLKKGHKFDIWPFKSLTESSQQVLICEAYPSYFWKSDWHIATRDSRALLITLKNKAKKQLNVIIDTDVKLSADHLDALVNALGVLKRLELLRQPLGDSIEGAIVI